MIEKLEFYHGAAIVRLIEDDRCKSVGKNEYGYVVNGDRSVVIKYTTKAHSPWRFTVSRDDIARYDLATEKFESCVIALVCGGDGVCSVDWKTARALLGGSPGWLAAKRNFNGCYGVSGVAGTLKKKIPVNQWPGIVFGQEAVE
jgi:hypothetical protein